MFQHKTKIRFSEIDKTGRLSMHGLLSLFQDIGYQHALNKGQGMDYTLRTGCTWFLIHWNIEAGELPEVGQEVLLKTCVYKQMSSIAMKSVWMEDLAGNILAKGDTMWAYFDVVNQCSAEYPEAERWEDDFGPQVPLRDKERRIVIPGELAALEPVTVTDYLVDTNEHANNVRLTELAMRLSGKDYGTRHLRAEFRAQTPAGEVLYPYIGKNVISGVDGKEVEKITLIFKDKEDKVLSVYSFE